MTDAITQVISDEDKVFRRSGLLSNGDPVHHVYVDQNNNTYFSATTILDLWSSEEKEKKLQEWRDQNNGEDGTEHHEDILKYTQLRGTLFHAYAQEEITDRDIWGDEEERAVQELQQFGEFYGMDAYERTQKEKEYFVETVKQLLNPYTKEYIELELTNAGFNEQIIQNILSDITLDENKNNKQHTLNIIKNHLQETGMPDNIINSKIEEIDLKEDRGVDEFLYVEEYVFNADPSYAGQVDLVYRDTEGDIVVCDLKTSKHVSYSYFLQTNAYANVIEKELDEQVDKLEICRVYPNLHSENTYERKTIDKTNMAITLNKVIDTDYGKKICLNSPFEAKNDIQDLNWDLFHQGWEETEEMWSITVKNKEGAITPDLAMHKLIQKDWSVGYNDNIVNTLLQLDYISEEDINFEKAYQSNIYNNFGDQLTTEFNNLAEQYEKNRPIKFPEDILKEHSQSFNNHKLQQTLQFIENNKTQLGDYHPHNIITAIGLLYNLDKSTLYTIFDPNKQIVTNLQQIYKKYK